jgi:hypothetical protein
MPSHAAGREDLARIFEGTRIRQALAMTKAKNFAEWKAGISMLNLPMFNTAYADADGTIFYVYNGAIPIRDPAYDWTRPVDGSDPRTEWKGLHPFDDLPQLLNPAGRLRPELQLDPLLDGRRRKSGNQRLPALHGRRQIPRPAPVADLPQAAARSARPHLRRLAAPGLRHDPLLAAGRASALPSAVRER